MTDAPPSEADQLFDADKLFEDSDPANATNISPRNAPDHLIRDFTNPSSDWATRWLKRVFVCLFVAAIAHEAYATYYDRKMTEAIRVVSGKDDVEVRCLRAWDDLINFNVNPGYVYRGTGVANLQLNQCRRAAAWPGDPTDDGKRVAIMVLSHELAHVAGHYNESETECVAMWVLPKTAMALGGDYYDGEAAAQWYLAAYNRRLPPRYHAPSCLSGAIPRSPLLR